jgi:protein-L-isoaspartate(D-aspartate) O-methyltransferase
MEAVDRKDFCCFQPYNDTPQSIGFNATISAPHMHAYCLELLEDYLNLGSRVLDVGI